MGRVMVELTFLINFCWSLNEMPPLRSLCVDDLEPPCIGSADFKRDLLSVFRVCVMWVNLVFAIRLVWLFKFVLPLL